MFVGFIYKITIKQESTAAGDLYNPASCDTSCTESICTDVATECLSQNAFNAYTGGSCDTGGTCDAKSCVRDGECNSCVAQGGSAYCHLCYDDECASCSDYADGSCNVGSCSSTTLASESSGQCTCNPGAGRVDHNDLCKACFTNCDACNPGGLSNYSDCSACSAGAYDISPYGAFKYCTTYCPSGWFEDPAISCTAPPVDKMVFSVDFNAPLEVYPNGAFTGNAFDVTPTRVAPSASPAKNRGLYWDGLAAGYVEIPSLLLGSRMSIHSWVLLGDSTSVCTLFQKTDQSSTNLTFLVNSGQMSITAEPNTFSDVFSGADLSEDTWYYLTYVLYLNSDGLSSAYEYYQNNALVGGSAWTDYFWIDHSTYKSLIGVSDVGGIGNIWSGYIYDFHIYASDHNTANTAHASACSTGCLTNSFDSRWDDVGSQEELCDGTNCANRSCVRDGDCQLATDCEANFPFCHLCKDRECMKCDTYTACNTGLCTANGNGYATDSTGECVCTQGNGRSDIDSLCQPCHTNCWICDQGGLSDYRDCLTCDTSYYQYPLSDATHHVCLNYCPSSYTGSFPSCVEPTDFEVYKAAFNTFASPWANSGISAISTTVYPAKERGQYFGGNDDRMEFSDFWLRPSFSIFAWVRLDDLSADYTVFSKDRDEVSNTMVFNAMITSTDGFLKVQVADSDDWTSVGEYTSTITVAAQQWQLVAYKLALQDDAASVAVTCQVTSNTNTSSDTITNHIYIDDSTAYKAFLGVYRTDLTTYEGDFHGFMYKFYIYNVDEPIGVAVSAASCVGSCSGICTDEATECLGDYEFTTVSNGDPCDSSTCTDLSCVRTSECHTCDQAAGKSEYCHLCFDRECQNCSDYFEGDCLAGNCDASGNAEDDAGNAGQCICSEGKGRDGFNSLCASCHTNCSTCNVGDTNNYSDCLGCLTGSFDISPSATAYFYCTAYCPTGYDNPTTSCDVPSNLLIASYDFNFPLRSFADSSTVNLGNANSIIVKPGGMPAKNRGIYFDGTNGRIELPAFTLNHQFSIHSWIFHMSGAAAASTIFHKSRTGFNECLNIYFTQTGTVMIQMALDVSPYTEAEVFTAAPVTYSNWNYYVFDLEMQDGDKTVAKIYQDNVETASGTLAATFMIDDITNTNLIGTHLDGTDTYSNTFIGYIRDFHIYQAKHSDSDTTHFAAGCSSACWTCPFDEYDTGAGSAPCDGSCNLRGCMDGEACIDADACGNYDAATTSSFCHLCEDRECVQCDTYTGCNSSQCTASGHASEATNACSCNDNYGRSGVDKVCIQCHDNCKSCNPGGLDDYSDCTDCMDGTQDIDATGIFYCTSYCPTGFDGASCTLVGGDEKILDYNFNIPNIVFESTGAKTGSTYQITATVVAPAGNPAKNRGLYFDGSSDGYVQIGELLLGHSFSVHSWVFPTLGASITLLSKDRNDFDPTTAQNHLRLSVESTGFLFAELAQDIDPSNYLNVQSDTQIVTETWKYVVFSFEMVNGENKTVKFYGDNTADGTQTMNGVFQIDSSAYRTYIGIERDDDAVFSNHWQGYIYNLAIYQIPYNTPTNDHYKTSACVGGPSCTSCPADLNCPYGDVFQSFYDNDTTSVLTCNTDGTCAGVSCVRTEPCHTCTSDDYCHLCPDRQCEACDIYTVCNNGSCGSNATNSADICTCDSTFGRASEDFLCAPCLSPCLTCDEGSRSDYADCLTCGSGTFELDIDGTHNYCLNYCPTGFTDGGAPSCPTPTTTVQIFAAALDSFEGPWTTGSINLTSNGTHPAKYRGQYFDGTDNMLFDDFQLHFRFSISMWIWLADNTTNQTLFSKDTNSFPDGLAMRAYTSNPDGHLAVDIGEIGTLSNINTTGTAGQAIAQQAVWTFVGYSISLENTANSLKVRMWINEGTEELSATAEPNWYIDDATAYKAYLGGYRSDTSVFEDQLTGFIYKVNIYNNAEDTPNGSAYYGNAGCTDCSGGSCTDVNTECMQSAPFDQDLGGNTCEAATCADISCVRDSACQTCTFAYCHLCYDRECTECSYYNEGDCLATKCDSSDNAEDDAANPGQCICSANYGRADVNGICLGCHTNCLSCDVGGTNNYSDCTACDAGSIYDLAASGASFKYCTAYCPTGYDGASAPACTIATDADASIITFNFNKPTQDFTNAGVLTTAFDVSVTFAAPSGSPAKNRGLYFDGTNDGFIPLAPFTLNHTFSIHAWALVKAVGSDMTLFSKMHPDATDDRQKVRVGVNASSNMESMIAQDIDYTNQQTATSADPLTVDTWYYLAYGFEMQQGNLTIMSVWINNAKNSEAINTIFLIDNAGAESFIALQKSASSSYSNHWNGYIYDFAIKQVGYNVGDTYFNDSGCPAACSSICSKNVGTECPWTNNFDAYEASTGDQPCDSSCDASCVRSEACQDSSLCESLFDFCHLCRDRECTHCDEYSACTATKCAASNFSEDDTEDCKCASGYGRPADKNSLCAACYTNCDSCNVGAQLNYSDCTGCSTATTIFDISPAATSYFFCVAECPTGYDNSSGGTHCAVQSGAVLDYEFDIPSTSFTNNGTLGGNTFDVSVTTDAPSGQPAKYRGLYFSASYEASIEITNLVLAHTFAVHSWVLQQTAADVTLLSKDRDTFVDATSHQHLRLFLDANGDMNVSIARDNDATDYQTKTATVNVPNNTWSYLVWSLSIVNGQDTLVKFYSDNALVEDQTFTNHFLIDVASYPAYIGAERPTDKTTNNHWSGFIYNIKLYLDDYAATNDTNFKSSGCVGGCSNCPASLICPWSDDYMQFGGDASGCDPITCNDRSCVRSQACQAACNSDGGIEFCHLCHDRECKSCDDYSATGCTVCNASGNSAVDSGACNCNDNYGRAGTDFVCEQCHENCKSCNEGGRDDYFDCTECMDGFYDIGVVLNRSWCVADCPTGFNDAGAPNCVAPAGDGHILSYNFISAFDTIPNAISAISNDITVTSDATSGLPATGRGYYFDGTNNGMMTFASNFVLNHTFTVMTWVYALSTTANMSILSKDKNDLLFNAGADNNLLDIGITSTDGFMQAYLSQDIDVNNYTAQTSTGVLANEEWTFLTYRFEVGEHKDTYIRFSKNEAVLDNAAWTGVFLIDSSNYPAYVALSRTTGATDYGDQWNGYIYELHVFQSAAGTAQITSSGCDSPCSICPLNNACLWDVDFTEYDVSGTPGTCDAVTCANKGCRADRLCRDCASTSSFEHCHMCFDYHCNECTDHLITSCSGGCDGVATLGAGADAGKCVCDNNLVGEPYTRSNDLNPCCATGCGECTDEQHWTHCSACLSTHYKQPETTAAQANFHVCFTDCPTGYTKDDSDPKLCTENLAGMIIDYDLTYIERDFENFANTGVNVAQGASSQGAAFADTLPYNLRGSYSDGVSRGIFIPGLRLHHTFTMTAWIFSMDVSANGTIFSKDRNDYSGPNKENLLDIMLLTGGTLACRQYHEATDWFSGNCESDPNTISDNTWYYFSLTFDFDGQNTEVKMYLENSEIKTIAGTDVILEDRDTYTNAWLHLATVENTGAAAPENVWTGFIYRFRLYNNLQTDFASEIEIDGSLCQGCNTVGTFCPKFNGSQCLWFCNLDELQFADESTAACDRGDFATDAAGVNDCPIDNGCVRNTDCNRCADRICQTCINFDDDISRCETCLTNASKNSNQVCECDNEFYFQEVTDACEPCDGSCYTCQDQSKRSCNTCTTGNFKQDGIQTCLDFCPNRYTENVDTPNGNFCEKVDDDIFKLDLSLWEQTFKEIRSSVANLLVQRGAQPDYGTDDPGMQKVGDKLQLHFDGTEDFLNINEASAGKSGLLLNHQMTITAWIYRLAGGATVQHIFSKIDPSMTGELAHRFVIGYDGNAPLLKFSQSQVSFGTPADTTLVVADNTFTVTDPSGTMTDDTWHYLTFVVDASTSDLTTDIKIYLDQTLRTSSNEADQFTDIKDTRALIGCSETEAGGFTNDAFFSGKLYEFWIRNVIKSSADIQAEVTAGASNLPDIAGATCTFDQYEDSSGACQACTATEDNAAGTVAWNHNECTTCFSAICTQCDTNGQDNCYACKANAALQNGGPGPSACVCNDGRYDNTTGDCDPCNGDCLTCTWGDVIHCQTCNGATGKHLQPDSYSCIEPCPTGYTEDAADSTLCTGAPVDTLFTFDKLTKQWSSGNVIFEAGETNADDGASEPYTYYQRGAFFDGTQQLLSLDVGSGLYLHSSMTFHAWFLPRALSGSLFSKSFNDWTDSTTSTFFDVILQGGGNIAIVTTMYITPDTQTTVVSAGITQDSWYHFGFILSYDKDAVETVITPVVNQVGKTPVTLSGFALLERNLSEGAIGARFVGNASAKTTEEYFNGYIYQISIYTGARTQTDLENMFGDNCTGGGCSYCPDADSNNATSDLCLWVCTEQQWFNGTSCEACPTCASPEHENAWDGCREADNCSVCADQECSRCDDFNTTSCNTCVTNAAGSPAECSCNAQHFYNDADHYCEPCDAHCSFCFGLGPHKCTTCQGAAFK